MTNLFDSMSKVVFLLVTIAVIGAMFMGKITGDQFLTLVVMVFTFYFAAPTATTTDTLGGASTTSSKIAGGK